MLGTRIAFLRRRAGLTQEELAAQLAVSPAAVGAYEQGRRVPAAAILVVLSQNLGVSVDYLLTGKPTCGAEWTLSAEYDLHHGRKGERYALAVQMMLMLTEDLDFQ